MAEISNKKENNEAPEGYKYPPRASIVCPKCGHMSSFPLAGNTGHTLEYVGVCGISYEPGLWCDAMITLQVTAHLAPVKL